jgi:hypothetical protein
MGSGRFVAPKTLEVRLNVAAGCVPNTAGIGLEETGVDLDAHGYIRVNDRLETMETCVNCGLPAHSPIAQTSLSRQVTTASSALR